MSNESPCGCRTDSWSHIRCEERSGPPYTYCRWERQREELGARRCGCGGLIVRNQGAWVCDGCGAHYDRQSPTTVDSAVGDGK